MLISLGRIGTVILVEVLGFSKFEACFIVFGF